MRGHPSRFPARMFLKGCRRSCIAAAAFMLALVVAPWLSVHAESLYDPANFRPLMADNRAIRVGDLITVQITEDSNATSSADTGTHRSNNLSASLAHTNSSSQTTASVSGDFDGGGQTQRTNHVLATLTVTVREILPNGDLKIGGEQLVTVNKEPQKVVLEGRVRPLDVSANNTVLSTRMADAKITYVGEGDVADRSHRPWWRSFLDWAGF
jgi:flagellar L-ring protein FlgH